MMPRGGSAEIHHQNADRPARSPSPQEPMTWVTGWAVLAILVIGCMLAAAAPGVSAADPEAPATASEPAASQPTAEPATAEPAATEPAADPASQNDGSFVIDANQLEQLAAPEAGAPAWDPAGVMDFSLTDQLGRTVTRDSLRGQPWVAGFIFTRCITSCPQVTRAMKELADRTKSQNIQLISITVDPDHDTVDVLREYAQTYDADPSRWRFLTGEHETIYQLIQTSFLQQVAETPAEKRRPGFEFIHTNNLMLVDAAGVVRGKFNSLHPDQMALLRRGLTQLLADSSVPIQSGGLGMAVRSEQTGETETLPANPIAVAPGPARVLPPWVAALPAINASLNALSTVLLIVGLVLIKLRRVTAHMWCMLSAFAVSVIFLGCYLVYHWGLHHYTGTHGKPFPGAGGWKVLYLTILVTHVFLAASVPILSLRTIYLGFVDQRERHKAIAKFTFPIWLYVSVTGVVIYAMLYHWPVGL